MTSPATVHTGLIDPARVKAARLAAGFKNCWVAAHSENMTADMKSVYHWEDTRRGLFSGRTSVLFALARAYGCAPETFFAIPEEFSTPLPASAGASAGAGAMPQEATR